MAEVIKMPRLSDTMEEGTVAKWHKQVGDKVSEGDLLAEIETDKATMDFEAFQEGTLLHIGTGEGETAAVDSILAILGEEGEDISSLLEGGQVDKSEAKKDKGEKKSEAQEQEEAEKEDEKEKKADKKSEKSAKGESEDRDSDEPKKESKDQGSEERAAKGADDARLKASPLARKLAEDKGIDIQKVKGSGEGGRIVKRDIDNYQPAVEKQAAVTPSREDQSVNVSQMRKTIARRLSESKFSAPHFYLTMDIDMDNAIQARKSINESGEHKISFNDLVIKATAFALRKHPKINSSWQGDKIIYRGDVNIGVAVAVEEGLLVPVIRQADTKGLSAINNEVKDFASRARDKKLQPADWEGNTFTISNLGMYGIEEFTAIINSPDSCILAVGGIKQVPVVKNGTIVPGNVMKVTLSCDHRVVDGASGAEFLQSLKGVLENPLKMLI